MMPAVQPYADVQWFAPAPIVRDSDNSAPALVFMLAGQSNMRGPYGPNPGDGFGPIVQAALSNDRVILVNCAVNGSSMSQWAPDGELYSACLDQVAAVGGTVAGVLFYQGETDAAIPGPPLFPFEPLPDEWGARFGELVAAWRRDFGDPALPIVFAEIGTTTLPAEFPNWNSVRAQQEAIDLPNVTRITTDDLALVDSIHFTGASYISIGERFASAWLDLSREANPP